MKPGLVSGRCVETDNGGYGGNILYDDELDVTSSVCLDLLLYSGGSIDVVNGAMERWGEK